MELGFGPRQSCFWVHDISCHAEFHVKRSPPRLHIASALQARTSYCYRHRYYHHEADACSCLCVQATRWHSKVKLSSPSSMLKLLATTGWERPGLPLVSQGITAMRNFPQHRQRASVQAVLLWTSPGMEQMGRARTGRRETYFVF